MHTLALLVILGSFHFRDLAPENGINPGLALSGPVHPHLDIEAGAYFNSRRGLSVYDTLYWHTSGRWQLGVHAGLVTGYDWPVLPLVFPTLRIPVGRAAFRVDILPTKHPIIGLQLELPFR